MVKAASGATRGLFLVVSVAAEALQLNCCAYGTTGDDWITAILPDGRFGGGGRLHSGCSLKDLPNPAEAA